MAGQGKAIRKNLSVTAAQHHSWLRNHARKGLPMPAQSSCLRSIAVTLAFLFASLPAAVSALGVYPARDEEAVICRCAPPTRAS